VRSRKSIIQDVGLARTKCVRTLLCLGSIAGAGAIKRREEKSALSSPMLFVVYK
jgi:hypothetical protein